MVICLERGADLHMAHLMPLPLTVSCFSKIQIGFTFLVPAHLGSPRKRAVKWGVCVCVCSRLSWRCQLWVHSEPSALASLPPPPLLLLLLMAESLWLCWCRVFGVTLDEDDDDHETDHTSAEDTDDERLNTGGADNPTNLFTSATGQ